MNNWIKHLLACLALSLIYFISCTDNRSSTSSGTNSSDSLRFRERMTLLQEKYANPNSPYRNEIEALKIYDSIMASTWYSAAEKLAIQQKIRLAQQNRIGQPANDFVYYTTADVVKRLYDLKAPYILLYFYNPECNACKEMTAALMASAVITQKIRSGELKLLAIYTDPDQTIWRKHLPELPTIWVHGRDEKEYLWKNKIYDLRAIPTLYLLDESKKVLLKDCMSVIEIENKLNNR